VWLTQTFKSFRENRLCVVLALTVVAVPFCAKAQTIPAKNQPPRQESLATAAKGTRIAAPKPILRDMKADPENCLDPSPSELEKMDGNLIRGKKHRLVAVWGRSSCFCSPTGNCAFGLFQPREGKYEKILETDRVNRFGFVHSTTNGLPDLVLWSHGSAFDSGGALWKFATVSYQQVCTWLRTSPRETKDGNWIDVEPYITENTCGPNDDQ
jgi:hypothetical protein